MLDFEEFHGIVTNDKLMARAVDPQGPSEYEGLDEKDRWITYLMFMGELASRGRINRTKWEQEKCRIQKSVDKAPDPKTLHTLKFLCDVLA